MSPASVFRPGLTWQQGQMVRMRKGPGPEKKEPEAKTVSFSCLLPNLTAIHILKTFETNSSRSR
jgi:hypothetical protein